MYDVYSDFQLWENDLEGSFGNNKLMFLSSLSLWLPILIAKGTGINELFLLKAHFFLRPVIIFLLFLLVAKELKGNTYMTALALAFLLFGNFAISNLSLTSSPFAIYENYYITDFFIGFLVSLLFHFRRKPIGLSLSLTFSILIHPSLGLVSGGFFIVMGLVKKVSIKYLALLILGIFLGLSAELILLKVSLSGHDKTAHDIWWLVFSCNGHLNFPYLFTSEFVNRLVKLVLLGIICLWITAEKRVSDFIKWGLLYLFALCAVYFLGHAMQSHLVMKLQVLRFSNVMILIFLLGVATADRRTNPFGIFVIFLMVLTLKICMPIGILLGLCVLFAFFIKYGYSQISMNIVYVLIIIIGIATPVREASDRITNNRPFTDVISYVKNDIGKGKTFLFWGKAPRSHMFRTYTKSKVIDPRRFGLSIYNESQEVFDDEMKKARLAGFFAGNNEDPAQLYVQGNWNIAQGALSPAVLQSFKREYDIDFVLLDRQTPVNGGVEVFKNSRYRIIKVDER
jgi:hypothetical protein